jgi:deoxyadenosine/deoxycytidine kinase
MANTKTLEELIEEVSDRNMKAEYDTDREEAYYKKMEKLYNAYVDENDEITKKYKIRTYFFLGAIISVYIGFFVWKATT